MSTRSLVTLLLLGLSAPACNDKGAAAGAPPSTATAAPAPAAAGPTAEDTKAATELFATRCTPCHGAGGGGDGPASAGLTPKPANFTSPDWQTKTTDEHIEKIVVYGGAAVGKSPAMPPNPDLDARPGVVKALRAHLRSLKK